MTCKGYRHEFEDHILELKQKYEEKLMFEKEAINKLRLECGRLTEDRMHLQNQLIAALSQQEKLEKDVRLTQYNPLYIELQPEKRVDTRTAKEFRDAAP